MLFNDNKILIFFYLLMVNRKVNSKYQLMGLFGENLKKVIEYRVDCKLNYLRVFNFYIVLIKQDFSKIYCSLFSFSLLYLSVFNKLNPLFKLTLKIFFNF